MVPQRGYNPKMPSVHHFEGSGLPWRPTEHSINEQTSLYCFDPSISHHKSLFVKPWGAQIQTLETHQHQASPKMPPDSWPGFKAISLAQRTSSPFVLWHCLLTASRARLTICTNWSEGWVWLRDKLPPNPNKFIHHQCSINQFTLISRGVAAWPTPLETFGGWPWGFQALGLLSMIFDLHCEQCFWPGSKQPMLGKVKTPAVAKTSHRESDRKTCNLSAL